MVLASRDGVLRHSRGAVVAPAGVRHDVTRFVPVVCARVQWVVRHSSIVQLPPELQARFGPGCNRWYHRLIIAVLTGIIRFVYRLLPLSFRYMTAYLNAMKRLGKPINVQWISNVAAAFTRLSLKIVLSPPPPGSRTGSPTLLKSASLSTAASLTATA